MVAGLAGHRLGRRGVPRRPDAQAVAPCWGMWRLRSETSGPDLTSEKYSCSTGGGRGMVALGGRRPAPAWAVGSAGVLLGLSALAGCTAPSPAEPTPTTPTASTNPRSTPSTSVPVLPTQPPVERIQVSLYHCGFRPLSYDGKTWEVPEPTPFDATNAPEAWKGTGTITSITETSLEYLDDSGIEVGFVADDDGPLPLCA